MPMLEVIHASGEPATPAQKQAFIQDATRIFHDVLGTPDGRLRIVFYALGMDDTNAGTGQTRMADSDPGTSG